MRFPGPLLAYINKKVYCNLIICILRRIEAFSNQLRTYLVHDQKLLHVRHAKVSYVRVCFTMVA